MSKFAEYRPEDRGRALADLRVRAVEPGDTAAIASLCAAYDGVEVDEVLPRVEREARGDYPREEHRLLVATSAGRLVGFGRSKLHRGRAGAGPTSAPAGWYLSGVIVDAGSRRRGVARALTAARLADLFPAAPEVYFVANARNKASHDLHTEFGFEELTRDFEFPRVSFAGGAGVLFRLDRATHARLASR